MVKINDRKFFACDECPICENFERRVELAKELGCEPQLNYCGCDKIQYEFWLGGYCSDAYEQPDQKKECGPRNTGRAYRRERAAYKNNERLNRMARARKKHKGSSVDEGAQQTNTHAVFSSRSSKQQRYKRHSNKKVRKYNGDIGCGNHYRRIFDYRWMID